MSIERPAHSVNAPAQHLPATGACCENGSPEPVKLEAELHTAIGQFKAEANKGWMKISPDARLRHSRMIGRFAIQLKREVFKMKQQGCSPQEIQKALNTSMKKYQCLIEQFEIANKDGEELQKTGLNQDLLTTIAHIAADAIELAICAHMPYFPHTYSTSFPEQKPTFVIDPYQDTQDEIDKALCQWESLTYQVPPVRRDAYLKELQTIEAQLIEAMNREKTSATGCPVRSHYSTQQIVQWTDRELRSKFHLHAKL